MFAAPPFMLALLAVPVAARAIWIPGDFLPFEDQGHRPMRGRDTSSDPVSCGISFPSDFTCPATSTCLQINTGNASITSVLCCPTGSTCSGIQPVLCDQNAQNATTTPDSELHSDPTTPLDTCGSGCCPMGATCTGGVCLMQYASNAAAGSGSSSTSSSRTSQNAATTTSVSSANTGVIVTPTSVQSTATATATGGSTSTLNGQNGTSSGSDHAFDGSSFAAGLVPGLFIGAVLAGLAIMCHGRKRRDSSVIYMDERHSKKRDTLGSLGPLSRRPTLHGRTISEPAVDASAGHRTDFLRSTPPKVSDGTGTNSGYSVEVSGPSAGKGTPRRTPKTLKGAFSHSPFLSLGSKTPKPTQSPMPSHLKRGTLSMGIAIRPVRSLRKQKSMHSLRRQMTQLSRLSSRHDRVDRSRSGSTETIQVMISDKPYTPNQQPVYEVEGSPATLNSAAYKANSSISTWGTQSILRTPPQPEIPAVRANPAWKPAPMATPTPAGRKGANADASRLGTPYWSSKNGDGGQGKATAVLSGDDNNLGVVREPEKRDTTFSAIMRKGGLDPAEFGMGTSGT